MVMVCIYCSVNVFSLSLWERAGVRASACAFPLTLTLSLKGEGIDRAHYCTLYLPNSSRLTRCSGGPGHPLRLNRGGFRQLVLLIQPFIAFTPCISLNSASWRIGTSCRCWRRGTGPSPGVPAPLSLPAFAVIHKEVVELVFGGFGKILRQTIGSPGISGDFQITFSSSASPVRRFSACRGFRCYWSRIHLLVGDGQRVGFMPGVDGALKSLAEILFLAKT